jgi:hypothetical protein
MRRFAIGFLLLLGVAGTSVPVAAAQATPVPVDPATCTIAPVEPPAPGEVGDLTLPSPIATAIDEANTTPADQATIDAVTATIAQSIACQNAGDVLRLLANFSERWIAERFSGYDLVFYGRFLESVELATPVPGAAQIELVAIEDVRVRQDGAALATVITSNGGEQERSLLVLIETAGGWRIDGSQAID